MLTFTANSFLPCQICTYFSNTFNFDYPIYLSSGILYDDFYFWAAEMKLPVKTMLVCNWTKAALMLSLYVTQYQLICNSGVRDHCFKWLNFKAINRTTFARHQVQKIWLNTQKFLPEKILINLTIWGICFQFQLCLASSTNWIVRSVCN